MREFSYCTKVQIIDEYEISSSLISFLQATTSVNLTLQLTAVSLLRTAPLLPCPPAPHVALFVRFFFTHNASAAFPATDRVNVGYHTDSTPLIRLGWFDLPEWMMDELTV